MKKLTPPNNLVSIQSIAKGNQVEVFEANAYPGGKLMVPKNQTERSLFLHMSKKLLVVGTMAYDAIETPYHKVDRILGGAATYIALASSKFSNLHLRNGYR